MKKYLIASAALAAILAGAPAFAQSLVVGADVDAGTLDVRLSRDTTANRVSDLIYSGLVQLNSSLEAVPELAESWEAVDATTMVFKLREGLKFSDGSALTAEDVVYTFQSLTNPDFSAPSRALYAPIAAIEAVDALTVKFTLSAPYAPLLTYLDIGIVPKALAEAGHDLALEPVGAGPYKLASWTRGSQISLVANENYWGATPSKSEITFKIIGDNSARAQAFEAGDLDVIQSPLSPNDIKRLAANDKFGNAVMAGLGVTYLNFNTADPLLADPKMRQAFAMLVDQATIVDAIYEGVDAVTGSVLMPSSWAYDASIQQPAYDIAGAVALFGELGWADTNGNGYLDKDGKELEIVLSTHSEDPNRVQSVEFLQANFEAAGVKTTAQISDWPSFSTNYVQKSQHQIALLGWLNLVDPDRLLFANLTTDAPNNWGKYSNAVVDAALTTARETLDQAGRAAAYQEAAKILAEDLPYYIVSAQGFQLFYNKDALQDPAVTPRGTLRGLVGLNQ